MDKYERYKKYEDILSNASNIAILSIIICFIIAGIIIAIIFVCLSFGKKKRSKNKHNETKTNETIQKLMNFNAPLQAPEQTLIEDRFPYVLIDRVLTQKEIKFYQSLKPITDKFGLTIFSKMRIADLVYIPKNHPYYIRWFNYIKAKHIDFILCRNYAPVLLIEVDDRTHDRPSRQKRDEFVDKIFFQLNLPILHIRLWNDENLENQIVQALSR